jgi:hypothetical protein
MNLSLLEIHLYLMLTKIVVKHLKIQVVHSKLLVKVTVVSLLIKISYKKKQINVIFVFEIDITGGPVPDEYQFLQFHMHWGSNDLEGAEHVIDGIRLPGEVR